MQILVAKNVAIFFAAATIAFGVATIVLAVQKADLEDELQDARDKLELISTEAPAITTPSTTTSSTTPPTTTTATGDTTSAGTSSPATGTPTITTPTTSTGSTPSGSSSTPSSTTTSTTINPWPTVTLPPEGPQFPTLPPGLTDPESIVYRLPTDLYAVKYRLYWYPDLVKKTCQGSVSIQIEIVKETNLIIMHAVQLEVGSVSILNMMAYNRIRVKSIKYRDELLIIELYEILRTATPYVVSMDFECNLEGLNGVYASSYQNEKGEERWIATSKFEPTYARRAFPCFDEPDMKAQFTITVVRPTGDGYHALSNMNVETENVIGDLTEVVFEESVPMSTYLACFIVSDFAFQEKTVKSELPGSQDFQMRVFSTAAQVNKVKYALDTGVGITEFYIKYFGIAYPLPKLDMAAIPDFVSGAMEHWGLVTYRETALLYDENISSASNKQRVATVVAHELAHMWFGNLVTMKWWNDLWLNEGFASYIEYKGVHHMHPEWQMLDQFLISDLHDVMDFDATLASHPIVQTVESPSQITELFDSITYSKGASVIRMLEDLVGDEKFRNGTMDYLNKFYFSNAETDDYLTEIEAQGFDFDVKLIMQTWTQQMGLPVVEVTRNGNSFKLTQKRFFTNAEDYNGQYDDSQFNYRWSIPITYFTNANSEVQRTIFNYNDQETTVTVPSAVNWIKFNKNQVGYYRVNYPSDMWQSLIDALNTNRGVFSLSDRAHLVSDVFALADAAQINYSIALDLSTYLEKELDYVPWKVGSTRLNSIKSLLYYTDLYSDFTAYGRKLLTAVVQSIGFEVGTDHLQNLMRSNLLSTACGFGHEAALQEAVQRFNTWLQNPSQPPKPDVRSTIYYYGMQAAGNEKNWNQVWSLYMAEQDAQEKVKLMEALAAIKEPWILQRFINLAWEEKNVRGQDYFSCLQYIANNRVGESLVWDYVRENWPRLVARFGISERNLGRLIPRITQRFASKTKLEEMEVFFAKYPEAGAGTAARKEALENVKNNIKWLEQNKAQIGQWLAQQRNAAAAKTNSL